MDRASPRISSDDFGPERVGVLVGERRRRRGRSWSARHSAACRRARRELGQDVARSAPGRKTSVTSCTWSTKVNARTFGELLAQRVDQHQRELGEVGDRAADVAEHDQLGAVRPLAACGGSSAARRRWRSRPGRYAGSPAGPRRLACRSRGQPGGEPPGQRVDLAAHLGQVGLARGGKSSRSSARAHGDRATWSGPFSSAIRRRASASTSAREARRPVAPAVRARLSSSTRALGQQRRRRTWSTSVCGEHPLQGRVRRPARQARTPPAHRAEPPDRLRASRRSAPGRRPPAPRRAASRNSASAARGRRGGPASRVRVRRRRPSRPHRRRPAAGSRGRRASSNVGRCACRLTSVAAYPCLIASRSPQSSDAERRDRVEVLGQRDRQPGPAQRLEERDVRGRAGPLVIGPAEPELLDRPLLVGGVLEDDAERVGDRRARRGRRSPARAGCAPSRPTRRSTATSSARGRAAGPPCRRPGAARPLVEVGHLGAARSRARARRRDSRGAGRGSAA